MRKVKYNYNDTLSTYLVTLTQGKVYDVVERGEDYIKIINDVGDEFGIIISNGLFTDVTSEYRNDIIDGILA